MPEIAQPAPPHYRWNFAAFVVDYSSFGVAFAFVSIATVLPALVRHLTTSAPLVGLVSTVYNMGWTLPQLAVARLTTDKPRKKPYMLVGLPFRISLLVIALALYAGLASQPTAMLVVFFVCIGIFALTDGYVSLVWFDILARAIPPRKRGLLVGTAQVIGGVGGVGAGALVGLILAWRPFPDNFALLFVLATISLVPSTIALILLREPAQEPVAEHAAARARWSWFGLLGRDAVFRRLLITKVLIGMAGVATPFYVVHAADVLRLPPSIIGTFVVASTVASIVASAVLGLVSERHGPRIVIHVACAVAIAGPVIALIVHLVGDRLAPAYPLVYVSVGAVLSAYMLGFTNYMLEIAPDELRPAYVGTGNTLAGMMAFAPVLGGWLLQATSYTVLFGLAAALACLALIVALGLKPPHVVHAERAHEQGPA